MKKVEQIPNPLNQQITPIVPIFCSFFIVAGLGAIVIFAEVATLTCQRIQPAKGSCQFMRSRLLGSSKTTIPLNQLKSAKVDATTSSKGTYVYRVILLTDNGEIPFTTASNSSNKEKEKNADQVNVFINNSEKTSLRIQQDDRWFAYPFGGLFILLGSIGVFSSLRVLKKD